MGTDTQGTSGESQVKPIPPDCSFMTGKLGDGTDVFLVRHKWGGDYWLMLPHGFEAKPEIHGSLTYMVTTHHLRLDSLVVHRPDGGV